MSKTGGSIRCSTGSLPSPGPYELVFIDIVGPLPAYDNHRYLLTMEDSFTKFIRAVPLRTITAHAISAAFYRSWIGTFHAPVRLHSDNGTQFSSDLLQKVCDSLGILRSSSTPYHPQGNGGIERFHRTLKERLRCCLNPAAWPENVHSVVLAYNSTPHTATGYPPFTMAFGFHPQPPGNWTASYTRGDCPLTADLKHIWAQSSSATGRHGKPSQVLEPGDKVLVRIPGATGLSKPWSEPKTVLKITGPVSAEVESFGRVHFSRLKFFLRGERCKEETSHAQ
jgi:hypothetical protein